jgi:hypothetical protein
MFKTGNSICRAALLAVLLLPLSVMKAQTAQEEPFNIKFGGYINWTANYDSRQTVSLREGYLLLYPAEEKKDNLGKDINNKANFNFLSIQTRLNSKIEGPGALGAKTSGFVEAEFFGTSEGDVNGLRLRHAYLAFKWDNTLVQIGQTWHPLFVAEVFPGVISFNTGVPFQPFSRNPQVRVTQALGSFNVIAALVSQRDFTSNGPSGYSSAYMRNAGIPGAHLQLQYKQPGFIAGAGADFKELVPRIETTKKQSTDEKISSYAGIIYAKYSAGNFSIAAEGVYGQNMTDYLMLGGYAVNSIDTATGIETYSNLDVMSAWTDISYGKDFKAGLFAGYSKNLGSKDKLAGTYYTRVNNIDNILRISPRIQYTIDKVMLGAEAEYTRAAYGDPDEYGKVNSAKNIANFRIILTTYYFF